MAVISNEKLKELALNGKVKFGAMPEITPPKPQPEEKDRQLELLEQIYQALVQLSNREIPTIERVEQPDSGLADILRSIESLLKQSAKPKPKKKKPDWEFNIIRDLDGRPVKVEARAK